MHHHGKSPAEESSINLRGLRARGEAARGAAETSGKARFHGRRHALGWNRFLIPALVVLAGLLAPAPAAAGSGGPDAWGYVWKDSNSGAVATAPGPFQTTTDLMPGFAGTELVATIPLPPSVFPTGFPFYGKNYTTAYLSTNGWLSFVNPLGNAYPTPGPIPSAAAPNALIAPLWFDTKTTTSAPNTPLAYYGPYNTGTAFGIYVRYAFVTAVFDIEIILYANGDIRMIYHAYGSTYPNSVATIGIENEAGTIGTQLLYQGVPAPGFNILSPLPFAVEFVDQGLLTCATPVPLSCGQTVNDTSPTTPAPQSLLYSCSGSRWQGAERVYQFVNPTLQQVSFDLTAATNQALFVTSACTGQSCLAGDSKNLNFPLLPPGTYYVIVDGLLATDNGPYSLNVSCGGPMPLAQCGTPINGSTAGLDLVNAWQCSPNSDTGPEDFYTVVHPGGNLSARLTSATPGLEVIIFDPATFTNTSPQACLAGGSTSVTMFAAGAGTYSVAVDGTNGVSGPYTLEVGCGTQLDCGTSLPLSCGTPTVVNGNTLGRLAKVDRYKCADNYLYNGPEEVYSFTVSQPATVAAVLNSQSPDMEALMVRNCDEGQCLPAGAACVGSGTPLGDVTLVVDGKNGAAGPYSLELWCSPPETAKRWWDCENPTNAGSQPPDDNVPGRTMWDFTDPNNFCPDACDFAMYAVVECGQEFHIPLHDVESGHIRIWDVLHQKYMNLEAKNDLAPSDPNYVYMTGTDITWVSNGCPGSSPNGCCDPRYNDRDMDIKFSGSPTVCGVYRLEFVGWGGFVWQLYANCTGTSTPDFTIYSNLCSALAQWRALAELQITDVSLVGTPTCPSAAQVQVSVQNLGCGAAVDVPLSLDNNTGDPPTLATIPSIPAGQTVVQTITVGPFSKQPVDVTVNLDPGIPGTVYECHEAGSAPVTCSPPASVTHSRLIPVCTQRTCKPPQVNVTPARISDPLKATKSNSTDTLWRWTDSADANAASTRLYRSGAKDVSTATRVLLGEKPVPGPSMLEPAGILNGPSPAYFQLVAVSCQGDLESPY